jgi:hypothetical protein
MLRSTSLTFALLLPLGTAGAQTPSVPPHSHQVYDVMRDGTKIGTSTTDIDRQGDTVSVKMSADITVKIMYVTVYRFSSSSTESWKGNHFVAYNSNADDNGTKYVISATTAADKVSLDVNGKKAEVAGGLLPASMWNREFLKHASVFDPDNGKRVTLKVADEGEEKLVINGVSYQTRHYKISGDFARDLWFEGDKLVRMRLLGSDKSVIMSDLRT